MNRVRRILLELWVIVPLAAIVGFLGPFGSYLTGDFWMRTGRWSAVLMAAYILVRPTMLFWDWIARSTGLPRGSVIVWGLLLSSFPMALVWHATGFREIRILGGYAGILPFALLSSLAILLVVWWAEKADVHLRKYYNGPGSPPPPDPDRTPASRFPASPVPALPGMTTTPRLRGRLDPQFDGPILALESEDHYVRVHGMRHSELLLMRLRDAIAEMDDVPGEQTHRSWWVARDAVADVAGSGRNLEIRLPNDKCAPVARDSVDRLRRSGFLPSPQEAG